MPEDVFRWVVAAAVVLACIAFLIQAALVFAVYRIAKVSQEKMMPLIDSATPIVGTLRRLLEENAPKVSEISTDAVAIVKNVREQVTRFGEFVKDFTDRAKAQVARLDGAVDETVDQVHHAGDAVKSAVLKPVREVNGLVSGLRAALSVYARGRRASVDHATQDEEMFI